jgi:TM2 domain-containing membrane protein YozV
MSQHFEQPVRQPFNTPKDPNTAFLIEMVGGFFGLLGLGYIYVGRTEEGIIRLIAWLVYNIVAYVVIVLLSTVIIGCFCIPVQLVIQIGVPLWSANELKKKMLI